MKKICIVGMGNMGRAISDALSQAEDFEVFGCDKGDDTNSCIAKSDIVIIAVKPQSFDELANSISVDFSRKLVISIMAGVSIAKISDKFSAKNVVRVMPNLPLKVAKALSAWKCAYEVSEDQKVTIRSILLVFGEEIEVETEDQIDMITALAGSGPAYFYRLSRAIKGKAVALGFDAVVARKIARTTFLGAASLLEPVEDCCGGKMIKLIASKHGTTEAALESMEKSGIDQMVSDAVDSAIKRSKELNES
ncbi:MAG: pyrroline-5-carboxylate reductase [bacterium]|nr:pyrroline-5-carboxylate reductase [bacterium]